MRAPLHPAWVWLPPSAMLAVLSLILASGGDHAMLLLPLRLNHGQAIGAAAWPQLAMLGDGAIVLAFVLPCIRRAPRCFWAALVALAIACLWAAALRQLLAPPPALFDAGAFVHAGAAGHQAAFLSGHAAAACALAGVGVMGLAGSNTVRAALLLLACLAGLARVMAGIQWPVDLLWDWLGGWLGAWSGLVVAGRWGWRRGWRTSGSAGLLAGVLLAVWSAGLLVRPLVGPLVGPPVGSLSGSSAAMPLQRLIVGACLVWGVWDMVAMLPRFSAWRLQRWRRWRRARPGAKGDLIKGRATDG